MWVIYRCICTCFMYVLISEVWFKSYMAPHTPTLHLTNSVIKNKHDIKHICWSNLANLSCFYKCLTSFIVTRVSQERFTSQVQCCTGCATEQVYYVRKARHIELVTWCKSQNAFVYKSCTMIQIFWGICIVLCKELCKSLIANLPRYHNVWKWIKVVCVVLSQLCSIQ